jgi:hypothetical protein
MKPLLCLLLFLALVMSAAAADITGRWSGTFAIIGPDGQPGTPNAAMMIVKQSGSTLTGTGGPDENEQWPIRNGKIAGNKVTVEVTSPDGVIYTLTMTVAGDKVSGDMLITQGGQSQKSKIEFTRIK